ncbi:unnamed protein product [Camellia sinensis]
MEGPWKLPLRFRDMEHFNPIIISKRSEAIAASAQKFSKSVIEGPKPKACEFL